MTLNVDDIDIRVVDQRIGMGIGGYDTIIRIMHKPTGIIIEIPRLTNNQLHDRDAALKGLEVILNILKDRI